MRGLHLPEICYSQWHCARKAKHKISPGLRLSIPQIILTIFIHKVTEIGRRIHLPGKYWTPNRGHRGVEQWIWKSLHRKLLGCVGEKYWMEYDKARKTDQGKWRHETWDVNLVNLGEKKLLYGGTGVVQFRMTLKRLYYSFGIVKPWF